MHDTVAASTTSTARALGFAALAGALGGLLVGGILGRVFMFVLAALNSEDDGVVTDDGFPMGRFTVGGTLSLISLTVVIGVIGGLLVLALRGLRFGPAWFRFVSMPLGATIVVGSLLVHEGVDFRVLTPTWVAVTLMLALPFLYAVMVVALVDRWVGDGPTFWTRLPAVVPWIARAAFTALIALALVDLVSTIDAIANPFRLD